MEQIRDQEFWNWSTHFIGIIFSIIGIPILIVSNNFLSPYALISILFFSFSLLFVYCSSTLYHYVEDKKLKEKLRVLDHISIYYLIAGSYAPVCFITLYEFSGISIFIAVLSLSIAGTLFKIFSKNRFNTLSLFLYLFLGWLILIDIETLFSLIDSNAKTLLICGGIFYSFGVFFYSSEKIKYSHAIWHIFVLLGSLSHYLLILLYII